MPVANIDRTGVQGREGTDVNYGNIKDGKGFLVTLDVSYFEDRVPRPVVIGIHGGSFIGGDKDEFDEGVDLNSNAAYVKGRYFTDLGYNYVSINYSKAYNDDLLKNTTGDDTNYEAFDWSSTDWTDRIDVDAQAANLATAINWVVTNADYWGFDATKIALIGHNAGADLAAQVSTRKAFVEAQGLDVSVIKGAILIDPDMYDIGINLINFGSDPTKQSMYWYYQNVYGVTPEINTVDYADMTAAAAAWDNIVPIHQFDAGPENYAGHFCIIARGPKRKIDEALKFNAQAKSAAVGTTFLRYDGTISDYYTKVAYDHEGIHRVLGGKDLPNNLKELRDLNVKNISTEIKDYLAKLFAGETPAIGNGNEQIDIDPLPPPETRPEYKEYYRRDQFDDEEIELPKQQYKPVIRPISFPYAPTWQTASNQFIGAIPVNLNYKDDVGLFGAENSFIKVTCDIIQGARDIEDEDYTPAEVNEDKSVSAFYVYAEVLDDPELDPEYEEVEVSFTKLPNLGQNSFISVHLKNLKVGNKYLDNWLDVRLYNSEREEHPYNLMYVHMNDTFYIGVHARNTRRLPYNVELDVGEVYVKYSEIPEDQRRFIMR